jgi:hypothetical protein
MRGAALALGVWVGSMTGCSEPSGRSQEAARAARALPAASGFPQYDPQREVTLLGKVLAGETPVSSEARTVGEWSDDGGRLLPVFTPTPAEHLWFPTGADAQLAAGMVRARLEVHGHLDMSVLVRHRVDRDPAVMSGYGVSIEGAVLRLHRWDRGVVLPMVEEITLRELHARKSLELVVVVAGAQLFASVYDGETLELIASAAAHDTTYGSGSAGLRAGAAHDPNAAFTLLTTMDATKQASAAQVLERGVRDPPHADDDVTPFGPKRYAFVAASDVPRLPSSLDTAPSAWIDDPAGEQAVFSLDTVGYERLRRTGVPILGVHGEVPWKVLDAAFRAREGRPPEPLGRGFVLDDSYKDPEIVEGLLRAYQERHPRISALVEIGRTHQHRPIWALKISDSPELGEDEPAVLMDGAHHSSELISVEYVLDAVDRILGGYEIDPRITKWVDGLEIWCVPVVNPDGVHRFMHESRFAGRKNSRDTDMDGFADLFEGVDLNRNYPFGWSDLGSSDLPTHSRYRGPAPGSEPETRAMMQLAEREHFAAVLSFHTDGTDVYSAYLVETRHDLVPDVSRGIGMEIAAAAPLQPGDRRYEVRSAPRPVAGCSHDWHTHEYGAMAYVVEGTHHNPEPDVRRLSIEGTRPIWMTLLDRVLDGPWIGGHVRDSAGKPIVAEVMLAEIQTFEAESWKSRARDGRFDRAVVAPGSYTLVVRTEGMDPIERQVEIATRRVDVDVVIE